MDPLPVFSGTNAKRAPMGRDPTRAREHQPTRANNKFLSPQRQAFFPVLHVLRSFMCKEAGGTSGGTLPRRVRTSAREWGTLTRCAAHMTPSAPEWPADSN